MIHHVYSTRILKKPFLLKWLYMIRYSFKYPCKDCIVKMVCKEGCKPLAQYLWISNILLSKLDVYIDKKIEKRSENLLRFLCVSAIVFPLIIFLCLCGVPVRKLLKDKISIEDKRISKTTAEFIERKDDP